MPLSATTVQLCFTNNVDASAVFVDDIVLYMVIYPEVVTYQMYVDPSTFNAVLIDLAFQDFFQEKYWVGNSLEGKVGLQIDGVEISSDRISQVENSASLFQLRALLT